MANKTEKKQSGAVIDESKHRTVPTFFQRVKHVLMAILMSIVFAQVMLFATKTGSVVIYFLFYTEFFFLYLIVCGILGWVYGDKFVQTLGIKSDEWWNIWGDWS